VAESASRRGDKSNCATNFLFKILPYLINTVIQDGIYFIKDFPTHEFSRLLVYKIPEYTQFAAFQRQQVTLTVARYQQDKVNLLNHLGDNVCTVIGSLQREIEVTNIALNREREFFQQQTMTMQEQMVNLQTSFIRQNQTLDRLSMMQEQLSNSIATINNRQVEMAGLLQELRRNNNNYHQTTNNAGNGLNVVQNENNNIINVNVNVPFPTDERNERNDNVIVQANVPAEELIQNQRTRRPRINGFNAIRGTSRVPPMRILFPESWLAILEEWNQNNLSAFVGYGKRQHFSVPENSRFSKRFRAVTQLQKAALARGGITLRHAAEQLDGERQFRIQQAIANGINNPRFSITNHLEEMERNDTTIRRRNGNPQAI
jgi:hypothetical protein